jgi:hypothetical protein
MFYIATSSIILVIVVMIILAIADGKKSIDEDDALRKHYERERNGLL